MNKTNKKNLKRQNCWYCMVENPSEFWWIWAIKDCGKSNEASATLTENFGRHHHSALNIQVNHSGFANILNRYISEGAMSTMLWDNFTCLATLRLIGGFELWRLQVNNKNKVCLACRLRQQQPRRRGWRPKNDDGEKLSLRGSIDDVESKLELNERKL